MAADLMWRLNGSLAVGPWPVTISPDLTRATLQNLSTLADVREIHGWNPYFTLQFADDSTFDVTVGHPGDGTLTLAEFP
ncbi:hypothetical protein [Actinoplanes sp. G11-F43]|uniref:hypothetical protein n=1 Tax=Actinoplanes sp. G11-F43 TaxID=3424130 RepID=UPI003D34EFF3